MVFQVIKNPVTDHLPAGSLKIGTSYHAEQIVDVRKFAEDKPVVFVVGAMAHGKVGAPVIIMSFRIILAQPQPLPSTHDFIFDL